MTKKNSFLVNLLMATLISMPLWPPYLAFKLGNFPGIDVTRVLVLITCMMWGIVILVHSPTRMRFVNMIRGNRTLVFIVLVPFFLWKIATALLTGGGISSIFSALLDIAYQLFIFLMALTILKDLTTIRKIVIVWVVVAILISTVAGIEAVIKHNLFSDFASQETAINIEESTVMSSRDNVYRVFATFPNPLSLASYSLFMLPFSYWLATCWRGEAKILGWIALPAILSAVYLTYSRAAMGGVVFMAGGYFVGFLYRYYSRERGHKKLAILIVGFAVALLIVTGILLFANQLIQGNTEKEAGSSEVRAYQMEIGVPAILVHPLIGYGSGNAAEVIGLSAKTIDNYYLTLALESGLPELILFFALLLVSLMLSWKGRYIYIHPWSKLSGAIFWAISSNILFMSVLSLKQTLPFLFVAISMLLVLKSNQRLIRYKSMEKRGSL